MLFLFRSAPEVKKIIHSKLFRKFWEEPGNKRANLHYCSISIKYYYLSRPTPPAKRASMRRSSILKLLLLLILLPEQTHATSQEGQHAKELHLEASPQKLSRLHLQKVSPPRLYTHACLQEQVGDQVQKRRKSIWRCSLWLELPFRETSKQC